MKRSEMIDQIKKTHPELTCVQIEDVITCAEKLGMMPPYTPRYLDHGSIDDCQWDGEEYEDSLDFLVSEAERLKLGYE